VASLARVAWLAVEDSRDLLLACWRGPPKAALTALYRHFCVPRSGTPRRLGALVTCYQTPGIKRDVRRW